MEGAVYKIWAAIGPLIGVLVGAWLTARWQRKRWIQDNKRAEYREVLDALQKYRWYLLNYLAVAGGSLVAEDARTHEERRAAFADAEVSVSNCLADRLFIRESLARTKVREDLRKFQTSLDKNDESSVTRSIEVLTEFHERILKAADEDLGLK